MLDLDELIHSQVFDVLTVKNIATKFLEKLQRRNEIIQTIKVAAAHQKLDHEEIEKLKNGSQKKVIVQKVHLGSFNQKLGKSGLLCELKSSQKLQQSQGLSENADSDSSSKKATYSILDRVKQKMTLATPHPDRKQESGQATQQTGQKSVLQMMKSKNKTFAGPPSKQ